MPGTGRSPQQLWLKRLREQHKESQELSVNSDAAEVFLSCDNFLGLPQQSEGLMAEMDCHSPGYCLSRVNVLAGPHFLRRRASEPLPASGSFGYFLPFSGPSSPSSSLPAPLPAPPLSCLHLSLLIFLSEVLGAKPRASHKLGLQVSTDYIRSSPLQLLVFYLETRAH